MELIATHCNYCGTVHMPEFKCPNRREPITREVISDGYRLVFSDPDGTGRFSHLYHYERITK